MTDNSLLLAPALPNDKAIRVLVPPGLLPVGQFAPLGLRLAANGRLTFTATVGMVARVHDRSANGRADAEPAAPPRLPQVQRAVLGVPDLADGRHADHQHPPDLAA